MVKTTICKFYLLVLGCMSVLVSFQAAQAQSYGRTELVAAISRNMPAGVAVSQSGEVFLSFPRWGDVVPIAVGRLASSGEIIPFPNAEMNRYDPANPAGWHSTLGMKFDTQDNLWVLDNARVEFQTAAQGAIKLVAYHAQTGQLAHSFTFPEKIANPDTAFLNDLVLDEQRKFIYISDMSAGGQSALIVYDIAAQKAWRALDGHRSVMPEKVTVFVEREAIGINAGIDGIALDAKEDFVYWKALSGRTLYRIGARYLRDSQLPDAERQQKIEVVADTPIADGLLIDGAGNFFLTDLEHSAVIQRRRDGRLSVVSADERIIWPDSLATRGDGWLYVVSNQINRMKLFQQGKDKRKPPYALLRIWIGDEKPVPPPAAHLR